MNKYINYYNEDNLKSLDFTTSARKSLLYGFGAIFIAIISFSTAAVSNLHDYTYGNFFFALLIGCIIFGICLHSYYKLRSLTKAKKMILDHISEIENTLFDNYKLSFEKTLVGVNRNYQLFILGCDFKGNFYAYIATAQYLHFSPVILTVEQLNNFQKTITGHEKFTKITDII